MQKKTSNCLVLLSGGQDSTTCLYWAKKEFKKVFAIGFDYGQKHKNELVQAQKIATNLGVDYKVFDLKNLMANSSLTTNQDHNEKSEYNNTLPASFTVGRNIIFLSIAGSYACQLGINDIITGVCQTDFSGYPDCRKTSINAIENVLSLAYGCGDFRIHTPLMYIDKAQTWKLSKELDCIDVIIKDTLTDYNGNKNMNDWGMGEDNNPATKLRKEGFYKAKKMGWL